MEIQYYVTKGGRRPFQAWLGSLDKTSRRKIHAYVQRVATGAGRRNIKPVGDGVFEIKIDYGPGFRVYFGMVGQMLILLLVGGDKSTQFRDIHQAKEYWRDYVSK